MIILFVSILFSLSVNAKQKNISKSEVEIWVTGYYQPVKNQDKYATGSFRGDMKMNGGKKTWSGKIPKIGMAAADHKIFPLGTRLYISELRMYVTIEDKGGKIKGKRIDVFTGRGDAGLERAIAWGKRKITVKVIKNA